MKPLPIAGIDPRSLGSKITPPEPLPFVSRRSLAKVRHYLSPISVCYHCDGVVTLVNNAEVYDGRSFGEWPYIYLCQGCRAYVSLHPKTDLPQGYLADTSAREARRAAKIPFNTLLRVKFGNNRPNAYRWLANAMQIEPLICHFSMFDEEQAILAFNVCFAELFNV